MGLFGLSTKVKRGRPKKRPKTIKEILSDAYLSELKKDPELAREISLRDAGHAEVLERDRETETHKKQIKKFVTSEALKKIQSDPELAEQFIEAQIEDILSNGKPSRSRRKGEPEFYGNEGLTLDEALEAREKLAELGITEGSGGEGFFKGMTMAKLAEALPYLAAIMGKGEGATVQPVRTYIVRVDGQDKELTEPQYKKLLQEGKLQPVAAALESPKPKSEQVPSELPVWLQGTDYSVVETWLDMEPVDFVVQLKSEVDKGVQESRLIWGFLTTATYDGIAEKITPYKGNPKVSVLVERLLSDEGKAWVERVLELVKESSDTRKS